MEDWLGFSNIRLNPPVILNVHVVIVVGLPPVDVVNICIVMVVIVVISGEIKDFLFDDFWAQFLIVVFNEKFFVSLNSLLSDLWLLVHKWWCEFHFLDHIIVNGVDCDSGLDFSGAGIVHHNVGSGLK